MANFICKYSRNKKGLSIEARREDIAGFSGVGLKGAACLRVD